ncbi:hypothetical protein [Salipaludibacillus keqinensis]|uniref:hypothetical protein n=1 Tax=Salipaludibacillus keqinensis TaxID=2045207 RepID=UPI001304E757|nr:hypothetical protein [Salipaludibacillus keqinensis]
MAARTDRHDQESKEMEKFFVTVTNNLLNKKEMDPAKAKYVNEKMKDVDFDNLFISK